MSHYSKDRELRAFLHGMRRWALTQNLKDWDDIGRINAPGGLTVDAPARRDPKGQPLSRIRISSGASSVWQSQGKDNT